MSPQTPRALGAAVVRENLIALVEAGSSVSNIGASLDVANQHVYRLLAKTGCECHWLSPLEVAALQRLRQLRSTP